MTSREAAVFADEARFMGYAARVMRGLIVDDYRRRRSEKRGGLFHITSLGTHHGSLAPSQDLVRISEALDALADVDPDLAGIIDLKFFCGFSFGEIAAMRGVSERTIQRGWEKGRLYLHRALDAAPLLPAAAYAAHQP
jgi:RNA polymerase sigma factor (TIGR02999 family)